MGGLASIIKRLIRSVTPVRTRANAGVYYETLPRGGAITGAAAKTLTAHATAAYKFGGRAVVLAATANTAEAWAEGVVISNNDTAKQVYIVALSTGTGAITAGNDVLAEVLAYLNTATGTARESQYLPLPEPVYIPANVAISLAAACSSAGKAIDAHLVISRNK